MVAEEEMSARMQRTRVCLLEFPRRAEGHEVRATEFREAMELEKALSHLPDDSDVKLRLFVVEDLSRSVIEALGARFEIDPTFFRDHAAVESQWESISKI